MRFSGNYLCQFFDYYPYYSYLSNRLQYDMDMKKLQPIDADKMIKNPFVGSLRISCTQITDTGKFTPDSEGVMHPVSYLWERQESVKIYYEAGLRDSIYMLSNASQCMLWYIVLHLQPGVDWVRINKEHYMNKNQVKSVNTYKLAVKELIRYCFIAQSADYADVFWINPAIMFNGNRIGKYPDNLDIKAQF